MVTKKNTKTVSLAEAQQAGENYAIASMALDQFEVQMNTKINKVKAEYSDVISASKERMEKAQKVLNAFADAQKENWDGKSYELLHCTIGFRSSPAKVILTDDSTDEKTAWQKVTAIALRLFPKLVKKSVVTTLDKKAIIAASKEDEKLFKKIQDKCGIDVVQEENFFIQPKKEEVAP